LVEWHLGIAETLVRSVVLTRSLLYRRS